MNVYKDWPNHYGVWADEFEEIGLGDCYTRRYDRTCVYVGDRNGDNGGDGGKVVVGRGYLRVDRGMVRRRMMERCLEGGVRFVEGFVGGVEEDNGLGGSLVRWNGRDGEKGVVKCGLVVDATGHELRFTKTGKAKSRKQGFQAAYGIEAEVLEHPFDVGEMLLMDFRDEHMRRNEEDRRLSEVRPTFLYVFPSSKTRVFLEETSVIAPEPVPFEELKRRLYLRLDKLGIQVVKIYEVEESLIPMGGSVPDLNQRVVGFGGAACLVHPATGYMIARTMQRARDVADAIADGMKREQIAEKNRIGRSRYNGKPVGKSSFGDMDRVAKSVWSKIWSLSERRQRDFLTFGADLLAGLTMEESRLFFRAFFKLPQDLWSGFLSFKLDRPEQRIRFALHFFLIADWSIRKQLLVAMFVIGRWKLMRSFLPLFIAGGGDLESHET